MQKVLSLCFPTYNRGWCVKEQLARIQKLPAETLSKIEIIISNNCSTDDTHEIVQKAISQGLECRYFLNETNLGMDGNFVACFKRASGKYIWLLGDDDYFLPDSVIRLVDFLSTSDTMGLIHIKQGKPNTNELVSTYFQKTNEYVREISYWTTFISANIVNASYVPVIEFDKYFGTFFTLMPLYITALSKENMNSIINYRVFEGAKDHKRNGGYNFFQVFVTNYLNIWEEFLEKGCINKTTFFYLKKNIFKELIVPQMFRLLIEKKRGRLSTDGAIKIVFDSYGNTFYFYSFPFTLLKIWAYCKVYKPVKSLFSKK